jgi:hypothetical protein
MFCFLFINNLKTAWQQSNKTKGQKKKRKSYQVFFSLPAKTIPNSLVANSENELKFQA